MSKTVILDKQQIKDRLKRIAYQIYEDNVDESSIVLAGIETNGYKIAKKIKNLLSEISPIEAILCRVKLNKENPIDTVDVSMELDDYKNKSIVLIDDVLNSGSTMIYAARYFLNVPLKKFRTVVLVDRNHKKFPIKADFKGISLSTSLNEHVEVKLDSKNMSAFLKE